MYHTPNPQDNLRPIEIHFMDISLEKNIQAILHDSHTAKKKKKESSSWHCKTNPAMRI